MKRFAFSFVLVPLFASTASILSSGLQEQSDPPEAVDVGNRLELFVDHHLIEELDGLSLRLHQPREEERVLHFDRPWEGNTPFQISVFQDGEIFRMYYRGSSAPDYVVEGQLEPGEKVVAAHVRAECYAQSRDGIHWVRPSLSQVEFQGSRENNILDLKGATHFVPFKDANPQATDENRYKAVGFIRQGEKRGLLPLYSDDAIHWKWLHPEPVITDGAFDSQNVAFWDGERGFYVALYRDFKSGVRTLKYATSHDFVNWTAGQWVEYPDTPPEHLYTNATVPYFRAPHIFLAFPKRFVPWRVPLHLQGGEGPNRTGLSDAVFMTSRDGVRWHRFAEAFIRPGRERRNWIHRTNAVGRGILATGPDELSLYLTRHYTYPTAHALRVSLRPDGFVSVHAGYSAGELITKPLIFEGRELILNYSTSAAGSIEVELQDVNGYPVPGFSLQESIPIWGDEIEGPARWKRKASRTDQRVLERLSGTPVRLRFVITDADLYSMQFR